MQSTTNNYYYPVNVPTVQEADIDEAAQIYHTIIDQLRGYLSLNSDHQLKFLIYVQYSQHTNFKSFPPVMNMNKTSNSSNHSQPLENYPLFPNLRKHQNSVQNFLPPIYIPSAAACRRADQTFYVMIPLPSFGMPYTVEQYRIYERLLQAFHANSPNSSMVSQSSPDQTCKNFLNFGYMVTVYLFS